MPPPSKGRAGTENPPGAPEDPEAPGGFLYRGIPQNWFRGAEPSSLPFSLAFTTAS